MRIHRHKATSARAAEAGRTALSEPIFSSLDHVLATGADESSDAEFECLRTLSAIAQDEDAFIQCGGLFLHAARVCQHEGRFPLKRQVLYLGMRFPASPDWSILCNLRQ
jgi:hypothetical protein